MSRNTLFKIRFNIVLVCGDFLSDFNTTVLYKFLLFQLSGQLSRYPIGGKSFFLLQNVRPGFWAHPASYSMDTTWVKHLGREVYHSSPLNARLMNEWSCISTSSVRLHGVDRDFFSYARYMPSPSRHNDVHIQCEAPVIQISACCYLPGPYIQPPHHSALQPPSV
jgi:hypothetical protein